MSHFTTVLISAIVLSASLCQAAASAKLRVSATVTPFISFNAVQNVSTYQINSDDLKRGYVDLPNSITIRMRTNLNTGVPVLVENSGTSGENSGTAGVLVKQSGSPSYLGSVFTLRIVDYHPNTPVSINCDSRVVLTVDAQEGNYPLVLSIIPSI